MSDLPPAEGSAEKPYVENPYTGLLKDVHWPTTAATTLQIVLNVHLIGPPITEPQDTTSQMIVSVTNLPALARTTLEVGNPDTGIVDDGVTGSFPADHPPGTIDGEYHFHYDFTGGTSAGVTFALGATASYGTTTAGKDRFGGAASVSMSVTVQVTGFYTGQWIALASSSIAPSQSLSGFIDGAATVTADLTLDPPSLSFG
jgi:hypothetical protein